MFYAFELEKYLEELLPERDSLLLEMEQVALAETIPVVTPAVGNFLAWLVKVSKAKTILEVGTAIGYSTLWLARAACTQRGHVTTIDMNEQRRQRALEYFARAGAADIVTALAGDARKVLPEINQNFDMVFIDAAKGEYLEYLDLIYPLLAPGGVLVVDNVLFRGWVVPDSKFEAKYDRLVSKLREFLKRLCGDSQLETSVLPFGDGLAICRRRE